MSTTLPPNIPFNPRAARLTKPRTTFRMVRIPVTKKLMRNICMLLDLDDDYQLEDYCAAALVMVGTCIAAQLEGYVPVMQFPNGQCSKIPEVGMRCGQIKAAGYVYMRIPPLVFSQLVADDVKPQNMAFSVMQWFLPRAQDMNLRGGVPGFHNPKTGELLSREEEKEKIENLYDEDRKAG